MINEDNNKEQENRDLVNKDAAADKNATQNWDEKEIINRNDQGQTPHNERRNLNADQEKRGGHDGSN